jgi:hypothetical protein
MKNLILSLTLFTLVGCGSMPATQTAAPSQSVDHTQEVVLVLPHCQELAGELVCQWIELNDQRAEQPEPAVQQARQGIAI